MPSSFSSFFSRPRAVLLGAATAVALGAVLLPAAQSQIRANPSLQPMGVSASGNGSTAWFHDPATGRAVACHHSSGGAIQCQAVKLPESS
ncbi:hypothetical protein [Pseudorhodoferax sp.]|uniref:hypothetical protein n=1 Tax=Pseudorhodoferax sp. TaxID=1993553 RepID=UPI0039E25111